MKQGIRILRDALRTGRFTVTRTEDGLDSITLEDFPTIELGLNDHDHITQARLALSSEWMDFSFWESVVLTAYRDVGLRRRTLAPLVGGPK